MLNDNVQPHACLCPPPPKNFAIGVRSTSLSLLNTSEAYIEYTHVSCVPSYPNLHTATYSSNLSPNILELPYIEFKHRTVPIFVNSTSKAFLRISLLVNSGFVNYDEQANSQLKIYIQNLTNYQLTYE